MKSAKTKASDKIGLVKIRRLILFRLTLALLVLLPQMMARVALAWACEGRVCSTAWGQCCCTQNQFQRDAQCGGNRFTSRSKSRTNSELCASGCGCRMVLESAGGQTAVSPNHADFSSFFPPLAVFTPVALSHAPALAEQRPIFFIDARGPPAPSYLVHSISLRAPPHA